MSFGQWQKLALARGFMRDRPLVVETGTHEALLAQRGQYAQLYSIQAAAYR